MRIVAKDLGTLQKAARLSWTKDMTIYVEGTIKVPMGLVFGRDGLTTHIGGLGELDWDNVPSRWPQGEYDPAGMLLRGNFVIEQIGLKNYQGSAAAVKWDSGPKNWGIIDSCGAYHIGTVKLGRRGNATTDTEGRTQVFEGHNGIGSLLVRDNEITECCTGNESLSHIHYYDGGVVTLVGNQYNGCGNPWGIWGDHLTVAAEKVSNPALCWDREGLKQVRPRMLILGYRQPGLTFHENTISGETMGFLWGHIGPQHVFRHNHLEGMVCRSWWAWDYPSGKEVTKEEWYAVGNS